MTCDICGVTGTGFNPILRFPEKELDVCCKCFYGDKQSEEQEINKDEP